MILDVLPHMSEQELIHLIWILEADELAAINVKQVDHRHLLGEYFQRFVGFKFQELAFW